MKIKPRYKQISPSRLLSLSLMLFMLAITGSTSAQTIEGLADRFAIAEQVARYSYTADAKDLNGFVALFTEEAVWRSFAPGQTEPNINLESRDAIRDFSADLYQRNAGIRTGHHQSGLLFLELTADTARTQNMILVTQQGANDSSPQVSAFGIYHDSWRKTGEGWLIESRTLHMDVLPISDR